MAPAVTTITATREAVITMQRHELEAWLGPALGDLTPEQVDTLATEADDIAARYPDPDDVHLRDAALSAAVQYLLGEVTPDEAGRAVTAARVAALKASAAAQQVARMSVRGGMSEVEAARRTGLTRPTVRKALGK